jgi:hypothetical protein
MSSDSRKLSVSHDTESPSKFWANFQDRIFQVVQLIDLRLALVIGLLAFMVAVGFDSAGNQAEAADLMYRNTLSPVPSVAVVNSVPSSARTSSASDKRLSANQTDASLATARRLRHGTLTSAVMTSNRLTQAHFFTDLPSGR